MFKQRSNRNAKRTRTSKTRKLNVQRLEDRQLMAANIFLSDGVLEMNGTSDRDSIEIAEEGGQIVASINSTEATIEKSFSAGSVTKITVRGEAGDDVIVNSTSVESSLYGGDGNDLIVGGGGNDYISAGNGHDAVYGSSGSDRIYGGDGDDKLYGESGNDTIVADEGNDQLIGGSGDDRMWGESGNDALWGESGADQLVGGSGDDYVAGGTSSDNLWGSGGDDFLVGDSGDDQLSGGPGDDRLFGGSGRDQLYGTDGNDVLSGESGDDSLYGGDGKDDVYGGAGRDYLSGGSGTDRLYGGTEYDRYANWRESMGSSANGPQSENVDTPTGRTLPAQSKSALDRIVDAAIDSWEEAGLAEDLVDSLAAAQFRVADLPAGKLATFTRATDGDATIWIDNDAGGLGWFIDVTPHESEEFVLINGVLHADYGTTLTNRVDLVTVVTHELGHVLGAEHVNDASLMGHSTPVGVRLQPDSVLVGDVANHDAYDNDYVVADGGQHQTVPCGTNFSPCTGTGLDNAFLFNYPISYPQPTGYLGTTAGMLPGLGFYAGGGGLGSLSSVFGGSPYDFAGPGNTLQQATSYASPAITMPSQQLTSNVNTRSVNTPRPVSSNSYTGNSNTSQQSATNSLLGLLLLISFFR